MAQMTRTDTRGRFVWYDLMTTDPNAAINFYTKLLGWGTQPFEVEGTPYTMWTNGETPLGGVMRLPDEVAASGAPPHWLAYVAVPDVDATAAEARALGATVMVPPTDIPTVGRFAVLADPQGAVFAIYTSLQDVTTPEREPQRGEVSWHELLTTDHVAAFDFYSRLFGWEKTSAVDMGPAGLYQMYGRNGQPLGGMYNKTADMPVPPNWLLYVHVEDVDRAVESVRSLGGRVLNGPMDVPGGDRIVQCLDPQGGAFALHSRKS